MNNSQLKDGIHSIVPRNEMAESARKLRDTYARKPNTPLFRRTFGLWMCIDHWYMNGLDRNTDLYEFFQFDPPGNVVERNWQIT